MTSEERREARYQRRKAEREEKKEQMLEQYGDYYNVIGRNALAKSAKAATKGVRYKPSVKRFMLRRLTNVAGLNQKCQHRQDIRKGFVCFTVNERGKTRNVMSVHFSERVVQKSLNVNALIPVLTRSLIYDNGAGQKGKGTSFAMQRMTEQLRWHYRHHGNEGYVLVIDLKNYFASIDHAKVKELIRDYFDDPGIIWLGDLFVDAYYEQNVKTAKRLGENPDAVEHVGLGLGSETNQTLAVAFPNKVDHFIKEMLRIKCYQRTMDDSVLIHPSKEYLQYCLDEIKKKYAELGLTVNEKKTQIVKLSHGFTYLKTQFFLTESGKIIKKPGRKAITRTRQVLKKHRKMVDAGILTFENVSTSYASRRGSYSTKTAGRTLYNLDCLFERLFINEIHESERRWMWWQKLRK